MRTTTTTTATTTTCQPCTGQGYVHIYPVRGKEEYGRINPVRVEGVHTSTLVFGDILFGISTRECFRGRKIKKKKKNCVMYIVPGTTEGIGCTSGSTKGFQKTKTEPVACVHVHSCTHRAGSQMPTSWSNVSQIIHWQIYLLLICMICMI